MSSVVETTLNTIPDETVSHETKKLSQVSLGREALNLTLKKIDFYEEQKTREQNRIETIQENQAALQTLLEKVSNVSEIDLSALTKEEISLINLVGGKTEGQKTLKDKDVKDLTNKLNNKFNSEQRQIELVMQNLRNTGYSEDHIVDVAKLILAIVDKFLNIIQKNTGNK